MVLNQKQVIQRSLHKQGRKQQVTSYNRRCNSFPDVMASRSSSILGQAREPLGWSSCLSAWRGKSQMNLWPYHWLLEWQLVNLIQRWPEATEAPEQEEHLALMQWPQYSWGGSPTGWGGSYWTEVPIGRASKVIHCIFSHLPHLKWRKTTVLVHYSISVGPYGPCRPKKSSKSWSVEWGRINNAESRKDFRKP